MPTKKKNVIRLLRADEIECRATTVREDGLSLILYKDARVDQRILDETFGMFGWKRSHQIMNGSTYCTVEVLDPDTGEWIGKQDVGTEANAEKEKSVASDSFKRACFNWGIGRELYSAPFIWVSGSKAKIEQKGDRFICKDFFSVASIDFNEGREIIALTIENKRGEIVYTFGSAQKPATEASAETESDAVSEKVKQMPITKNEIRLLNAELKRTGVTMAKVRERYKFEKVETMPIETYNKVMQALQHTADAA